MPVEECLPAFGNGDLNGGNVAAELIAEKLNEERRLNPLFAKTEWSALSRLRHKLNLLEEACARSESGEIIAERSLGLIACAIRFFNREWKCDD